MLVRRVTIAVLLIAASAAAASFPPINYRHRTLANGLEVYSIEDHATPTVAINVWYRVGSKNDPEGRSGFAHLFEHIMFKATAHMKSEMMDRLTEDVGGMNNAYTHPDRTVYYEVIPSNYLQTLLWAEGERMGALTVDEANFKSERDVVKEEYRFRILAPSYGRFNNALTKDSYAVHPYKRPGIGSIEDLDASTLADVQAFHSTYYRPDNAVLIVAGDLDPKQFDTWVDRYLGAVPKPSTAIPRVTVKEPARAEEKHFDEHGANVPLPAVGADVADSAGAERRHRGAAGRVDDSVGRRFVAAVSVARLQKAARAKRECERRHARGHRPLHRHRGHGQRQEAGGRHRRAAPGDRRARREAGHRGGAGESEEPDHHRRACASAKRTTAKPARSAKRSRNFTMRRT